jgi:hypothetical protein
MSSNIINLDEAAAMSKIQGLGYVGDPVEATLEIASFTFGSGTRRSFTLNAETPVNAAASLTKLRFRGVGNAEVNNSWVQVFGNMNFRNTGYDVAAVIARSASGMLVTVQFYNPTGGNVTPPAISVDMRTLFLAGPWG